MPDLPILQDVNTIPVSGGSNALVSAQDWPDVKKSSWCFGAGKPNQRYIQARRNRKAVYLHRLFFDSKTKFMVDHINGDTRDNRRENLRLCSQAQNNYNSIIRKGRSKFKGVTMTRDGTWNARIKINGRYRSLGCFRDERDAAKAYDRAAIEYYGEFSRTNSHILGDLDV